MSETLIEAPVSQYDPFDPEVLAAVHHHDGLLREVAPVVYIEKYDFYAITRAEDIQKALRNFRVFSSADRPFYEPNPFRPNAPLMQDPPEHTQTKSVMLRIFSQENMDKMESYFTEHAERLVDELLANGSVELDAYKDLAARYVLKVFPDILGLPEEGRELLLKFGDAVFNVLGPHNDHHFQKMEAGQPALEWVGANVKREKQSEGGIGWQLYQAADEGIITPTEAEQLLTAVFGAGFDTTVFSIAGMLRAFADNPKEWAKLRENPDLVESAFEEAVRYFAPSRYGGRVAKRETELGGVRIPEGAKILVMWLGAGRDPRKWESPDEFRIDRPSASGHLSFGFGIHTCAGQAVARMEGRSILRALVKRVASIELTGEPRHAINFQAFGHDYIPVRMTPDPA
ncbi:cytochrome P450 [Arthrobacter bambusae]|uniref:Cytochrome P450 n=1 Tax=Arthrobacter bambusae TaxID=1338426 RepID=A0ABV2P1M7_9MICC